MNNLSDKQNLRYELLKATNYDVANAKKCYDFVAGDEPQSQPKDRGILLRDILEDDADVDEKYYLSDKTVQTLLEHKARNEKAGNGFGAVFHTGGGKMHALKVGGKGVDDLILSER